jgi:hypothetical protein
MAAFEMTRPCRRGRTGLRSALCRHPASLDRDGVNLSAVGDCRHRATLGLGRRGPIQPNSGQSGFNLVFDESGLVLQIHPNVFLVFRGMISGPWTMH